ncbi:Retrotransposon gag domain [Sesbania bispinosa]|nr:Retrotransposon gag domain [Sesbania bispinosa]
MLPTTRIPPRREAYGESASQPYDHLQRGRGPGRSRGVKVGRHGSAIGVANAKVARARRGSPGMAEITTGLQGLQQINSMSGTAAGGIEVTLSEFMKLKPPTFSRAVELASFQLEGMAYDWFDIVTHGRSIGSPPLAWGESSRLFMACFLPESVRDGLTHEFERLEQTEGMSVSEYSAHFTQLSRHVTYPITEEIYVKRFVRGLSNDRRRNEALVEILARNNGLRDRKVVTPVLVWDLCPIIRCSRVVSQRGGHIRRDCPVAVMQPSSSYALAPPTSASSQAPFTPVKQFGGSSGQGSRVAQRSGRGSGGRGQAQAGRGQARVFAMTRQDAQASNIVVTSILSVCS